MANQAALIRAENAGKNILRRGRRFLEFDMGGNQRRLVTTIDPLHVRGGETEIDTTWVPSGSPWDYQITSRDFHVRSKNLFNGAPLLRYSNPAQNEWVDLQPRQLNWHNDRGDVQVAGNVQGVSAEINDSDGTLHWTNAFGAGRHFEYQAQPTSLSKKLIVDSYASFPAPSTQIKTGGDPVLQLQFQFNWSAALSVFVDGVRWTGGGGSPTRTTANEIEFRRAGGEVAFAFRRPFAEDANGSAQEGVMRVSRSGNNILVEVRVSQVWFADPARSYPVEIDPTFTDGPSGDVTTSKDTRVSSSAPLNNYGTRTDMSAGTTTRGLVMFDLSSIPADATCVDATVYFYQVITGAASAFTATIYAIASGNAGWIEGTKSNAQAGAGEPCWNAKEADGAGGVTTAWAGSAGLSTSGTDYETTSIGSFSGNRSDADGTEYSAALTAAHVEDWFGGGTNYGILLILSASCGGIGASDHATSGYRPKLVVNYTAAAGGSVVPILMRQYRQRKT